MFNKIRSDKVWNIQIVNVYIAIKNLENLH